MSFVENCKGPQRCRWERRLWTTNRTTYAFDQRTEMALKNSAFVIGMVTWALLTACNGESDGTTVQDTGSAEDTSTTMDAGAESDGATTQDIGSAEDGSTTMDGGVERVRILAAFMGLDSRIPGFLFGCGLSGRQDGMPIVLDRRIPLPALLDPSVFVVHRASGAESPVGCATLAPADEAEERRTILLVGEFASDDDPPVGVEIVGTLLTDDGVDAKGALTETVVPLAAGPSIVMAEHYAISELPTGGEDECPADTDHIIKTTWEGGVSAPGGADLDESHRLGTTVEYASGEVRVATLLADAFDNDNHVELCMSEPGEPVAITAGSGLYEDPNGDLNVLHTQVVIDAQELSP